MDEEVKKQIKKRFYGHDKLKAKYQPQIPLSAEREYIRLTNAYMGLLKSELKEALPELKEAYKVNLKDDDVARQTRNDSATDMMLIILKIFQRIFQRLTSKTEGYGLRHKLESLAHLNRKLTVEEWKKTCKATLGIDILSDYYLGDFYKEEMEAWVDANVDLIKTIPLNTLDKMKEIVFDNYAKGEKTTSMVKAITKEYNISKNHARFIARDQTAKLNGAIQKAQQEDAGITQYEWSSSGDERVRASHAALDGQIFDWSNPPTNSDGRTCHPGEDFNCRCIASPIFNKTNLNLPVEGTEMTRNMFSSIDAPKILNESLQKAAYDLDESIESWDGNNNIVIALKNEISNTEWIEDKELHGAFSYKPDIDKIAYNPKAKDYLGYDMDFAQVHEYMHKIDYNKVQSWNDVGFDKEINKALSIALKNKELIEKWFYEGGIYEHNFAISDFLSSLTYGSFNGILFVGHSPEYYLDLNLRKMEIWSNIITNDLLNSDKNEEFTKLFADLINYSRRMIS